MYLSCKYSNWLAGGGGGGLEGGIFAAHCILFSFKVIMIICLIINDAVNNIHTHVEARIQEVIFRVATNSGMVCMYFYGSLPKAILLLYCPSTSLIRR